MAANLITHQEVFKVGNVKYKSFNKTFIIAEAGSNHGGNYKRAIELIDIASSTGCDAVKFQLYTADKIIQKNKPGWKILKTLELPKKWLIDLLKHAHKKKIFFGISVFDTDSIDFLKKIKVDFLKIASTEIQDLPLIKKSAQTKIPLIISTGASNIKDIFLACEAVRSYHNNFSILHTVSIYPANNHQLNLRMIKSIKTTFGVNTGFSDHSMSPFIPSIATTLGASVIEKHITYSRLAEGPDHFFALEKKELSLMVEGIRESEIALGNSLKQPVIKNERKGLARRIVAKKEIKKNQTVKRSDLIVKRADQKGIHSEDVEKIINLKTTKLIKKDKAIKWEFFKS
ncbi:N-acetylneuraminate synthase family protein [Candidatus Pelagibacter sp.]|jgi:N,N'-diacetyllegionaminate synthase|nr:N-acetylneuraminate synthase family protein [Candidatus Pelagibacter sp.]